MFCMGCGAEIHPHAEACSVCGRPVSTSPAAVVQPASGRLPSNSLQTAPVRPATVPPPPAPLPLARPLTPSIDYGDTRLVSIPRDAAGRLVLVLSVLLAADLYAPWIAFDGTHIAPSRFIVPALLLTGLFAAATVVALYAPFRQAPYYAAFPVLLGAGAFGASALLALVVGPLASPLTTAVVAHVMADPAISGNLLAAPQSPPTLALAADTGLYVFLIGSGILAVAGYQMLIAAGARPMAAYLAAPRPAASTTQGVHEGVHVPDPAQALVAEASISGGGIQPEHDGHISGPLTAEVAGGEAGSESVRPVVAAPAGPTPTPVVLPGTAEWTRAPESPNISRNAPPLRGLGARGGRR